MKKLLIFFIALIFIASTQAQVNPPSVKIGNQTWMVKNLDVTKYRNGDPIQKVTDPNKWAELDSGAYCYYKNDSATYAATYGKLYNWYAVNDPRGLAPAGWHIPSDTEWTTLTTFLGGDSLAGGAMKEIGIAHWAYPNTGANNKSGFKGLPGGYRMGTLGAFAGIGNYGCWWSSTEVDIVTAFIRDLRYDDGAIISFYGDIALKMSGFSVRCIRD
jgi:uncharacterized protein (TIGR02145 family)